MTTIEPRPEPATGRPTPDDYLPLEQVLATPAVELLPPTCGQRHPRYADIVCHRDAEHRGSHQHGDRIWRTTDIDPHAWPKPRPVGVLGEVADERARQDTKWGEQNHPDGTGPDTVWTFTGPASWVRLCAQRDTDDAAEQGAVTWRHIALEEVAEAFAEEDEDKLRTELIQAAAVFTQWAQAIDRRRAKRVETLRAEQSHAAMLGSAHRAGPHL